MSRSRRTFLKNADDSNEKPGYSTIGTLYAIGNIRGLMEGVEKSGQ